LLLAGCVGPFGGQGTDGPGPTTDAPPDTTTTKAATATAATPAATDTRNGSIPVTGGTLPVDTDRIYARTMALLAVDDAPPTRIAIRSRAKMTSQPEAPPFLTRLGVDYGGRTITVHASTGGGTVLLSRGALNRSDLAYVLAHEFTHVAQHGPQNASRRFYTSLGDDHPGGIDITLLQRSFTEGAATYVGNAYWTRYVERRPTPAASLAETYERASRATTLYGNAPYYYGYRYLAARNVSTTNLAAVYDDPPRTTEELLHGLAPGSEPPANLTVATAADGWETSREGRVGELGTRLGLRSERSAPGASWATRRSRADGR
jgi:hypothetical protein